MPDEATLRKLIRKGTLAQAFVPVLCGSAFKNKGVQTLLDAVTSYLPSPLDVPAMKVPAASHQVIPGITHVPARPWRALPYITTDNCICYLLSQQLLLGGNSQSQGSNLKPPALAPDPIAPAGRRFGAVWRDMTNRLRIFFESRFSDTF